MTDHIVIIGGGPGGYEAAHVAAQPLEQVEHGGGEEEGGQE